MQLTQIDSNQVKTEANALGFSFNDVQLAQFETLAACLIVGNRTMNLTAITDPHEIVTKHLIDSLTVLAAYSPIKNARFLDLGTGAGFPGLPLLIARPDLRMTLLDSTAKKLAYVQQTLSSLELEAVTVHARAEELGQDPAYRAHFDLVCSRAVAALPTLCEYCIPFLKIGGVMIAMKGSKAPEEMSAASDAIYVLGGELMSVKAFSLADGSRRELILIRKISHTPSKYPRTGAQIAKKPL